MLSNKDYDKLAKEADSGFNGLGKIVKAIAILDQKNTKQQEKMVKLTWPVIIMTAIILALTILISAFTIMQFYKSPVSRDTLFNIKPKTYSPGPSSHTDNIEKSVITTNEINQNKTKTD